MSYIAHVWFRGIYESLYYYGIFHNDTKAETAKQDCRMLKEGREKVSVRSLWCKVVKHRYRRHSKSRH